MKAAYHFHTFAYRDPRSAFSSATGLPIVSPTAVLLGVASTLFNLGQSGEAQAFLGIIHTCRVAVDPPDGIIFFRAFHQLRRYYSTTKGKTERAGFTNINQSTREYGLVDGVITLFVGVPESFVDPVRLALRNRDHLGTHDSLCSLVGDVEVCPQPEDVIYLPPEEWQSRMPLASGVTILTLSRFGSYPVQPTVGKHWWMAGGEDTELVPYVIKGKFWGTSRGKIYRKN
ncbi:MAG: hypothetical protein HYY46_08430 [Deltaproteobacteria bacterium]|nr:hypothetical protein [Deltaproteobacteria bacterium]